MEQNNRKISLSHHILLGKSQCQLMRQLQVQNDLNRQKFVSQQQAKQQLEKQISPCQKNLRNWSVKYIDQILQSQPKYQSKQKQPSIQHHQITKTNTINIIQKQPKQNSTQIKQNLQNSNQSSNPNPKKLKILSNAQKSKTILLNTLEKQQKLKQQQIEFEQEQEQEQEQQQEIGINKKIVQNQDRKIWSASIMKSNINKTKVQNEQYVKKIVTIDLNNKQNQYDWMFYQNDTFRSKSSNTTFCKVTSIKMRMNTGRSNKFSIYSTNSTDSSAKQCNKLPFNPLCLQYNIRKSKILNTNSTLKLSKIKSTISHKIITKAVIQKQQQNKLHQHQLQQNKQQKIYLQNNKFRNLNRNKNRSLSNNLTNKCKNRILQKMQNQNQDRFNFRINNNRLERSSSFKYGANMYSTSNGMKFMQKLQNQDKVNLKQTNRNLMLGQIKNNKSYLRIHNHKKYAQMLSNRCIQILS